MTLATRKPLREKKCRHCKGAFIPVRPLQIACEMTCAIALARKTSEREQEAKRKKERAALRAAREKIKGRGEYMREAQNVFNAYIRQRDRDQPCISCGTTADVQYAAGHYRTVGACPELRFEPLNVHRQCNRNCNMGKSGNLIEYRIGLVARIGADKVAWLEGRHEAKRYTIDDLKEIKTKYRAMARRLRLAQVKP